MQDYECEDCKLIFGEMDQTRGEYKAGQCPGCHSERIKEASNDVREPRRAAETHSTL